MDPDRIERLLRLSRELEEFERDLAGDAAVRPARALSRIWAPPLAAAAGIAAAIGGSLMFRSAPSESPSSNDVLALIEQPGEGQVLVSVYEGTDPQSGACCDGCQCIQVWNHQARAGERLDDVAGHELIDRSLAMSCMPDPQRVTVFALTGPPALLPSSDAEARSLVACVLTDDFGMSKLDHELASAAMACLPPGVNVLVHSTGR